jgi:hypothetical protein
MSLCDDPAHTARPLAPLAGEAVTRLQQRAMEDADRCQDAATHQ